MTRLSIGVKTNPQDVDWATLDAIWSLAGEYDVLDAMWLNDHLTDSRLERGGRSLEALTLAASLAHRVPGKWVGHSVLCNTFRHPAILAKSATVMDQLTGGRFNIGLGAGWHEGEHAQFGLSLPPIGERIDRLGSAVAVLRALFSPAAATLEGVTLEDRFYPLRGATNLPGPIRPGGPPIWLGGQQRRGIALAARSADGWVMAGDQAGGIDYFRDRRDALLRALDEAGRDPAHFEFAGQVTCTGDARDHEAALRSAIQLVQAGATHLILGVPSSLGPEALRIAVRDVAEPLRVAFAA